MSDAVQYAHNDLDNIVYAVFMVRSNELCSGFYKIELISIKLNHSDGYSLHDFCIENRKYGCDVSGVSS